MTAATILVRDGTAYLDVADPEVFDQVVDATSFTLEGNEHRPGKFDKRTKLVRSRKCPVGLLDRVCRTLVLQGLEPQVTYANSELAPKPEVQMRVAGATPRDYQVEAELAAMLADRGIFRVPTGGGKSLIALMVIAAKGRHGLVIVPTIDLLYQFKAYATEHLELAAPLPETYGLGQSFPTDTWRIGQLGDGKVDPQPITISTIRTISKVLDVAYEPYKYAEYDDRDDTDVDRAALRGWVESIGTVVVDEAHQLGAKVLYECTTRIPAFYKYGMSASPWRDDGADLMIEAATGPPIYQATARRLVEGGWLLAPEIRVYDTSSWWHSAAWGSICARCGKQWLQWVKECGCSGRTFRSQFGESYKKEIVQNVVRNARIAGIVGELVSSGRTVLVLVKQVKHGRDLAKLIPSAVFLSGRDKGTDRQAALEQLRRGELRVLVCTAIADMGIDVPQLGALVLAGGGKSSTRHLQRIGRVVRTAEGKAQPIVVDLNDAHVHGWYERHFKARKRIVDAEWGDLVTWRNM